MFGSVQFIIICLHKNDYFINKTESSSNENLKPSVEFACNISLGLIRQSVNQSGNFCIAAYGKMDSGTGQ